MDCLYCHRRVDCHGQIKGPGEADDSPDPGDATICLYCGGLMVFSAELTLRKPTRDELEQMLADTRITTSIHAIGQLHGIKKQ